MTKNSLLNIAISISRLLNVLLVIGTIGLTILFIYVQIDNEAWANQEIKFNKPQNFIDFSSTESVSSIGIKENISPYTIGKLKTLSLYLNYIKVLIIMVLIFLSIRAFEKIMLSVKTSETFSRNNAKLFRDIGKYVIFITILTSYSVFRFDDVIKTQFSISLIPLFYALLAFIMAEIFKEGSALKQENELTI